eukprot:CAMPEP_0170388162 /NCGR_PEP_ID=MMETSP0117_2-20130122/17938_1 /TAXON_ID=400756 /ORGANISM="Durinskia baltica, Strain CSIRO CS-38" /LENGTH=220 /DNA_ID=CAMNT_0010644067 /DNA_START=61 /DNA_END=724 /DNA_ORIENTATION=+
MRKASRGFPPFPSAGLVLGSRALSPNVTSRLPELLISFVVFLCVLALFQDAVLILNKCLYLFRTCAGGSSEIALRHHNQFVRKCFVYFQVHQMDMVEAYLILGSNTIISLVLLLIDRLVCNAHTWWLLNRELGRTPFDGQYLAKSPPQIEFDQQRDLTSLGTNSDVGEENGELSPSIVVVPSYRNTKMPAPPPPPPPPGALTVRGGPCYQRGMSRRDGEF